MKGSRRGYSADIEEEDEGSAAHVKTSSTAYDFYLHVVPKQRRKKIRHSSNYSFISRGSNNNNNNIKHQPAIDMSLVSLLTSKELDTRKRSHYSHSDDDSSTSGNSQVIDYKNIVNETKQAYSFVTDGPLVVIDYGSIELGSGSLLDSIYKISDDTSGGAVASTQHGSSSKDVIIGRRRFSLNTKKINQTGAAARCGTSANLLSSGSFNTSPEFASLHSPIPLFASVPTTLEAAITFSPYARVLFCAQAPHTVLYANAVYVTLAQRKGISNPFISGQSFSSRNSQILHDAGGDSNSEVYILQLVSDHVRAIFDNDEAQRRPSQAATTTSLSHHATAGNVKIFRIMSSNQKYNQFVGDYTNAFQQSIQSLGLNSVDVSKWDTSNKPVTVSNQHNAVTQNNISESVTHYLLQIEPGDYTLS